MSTQKFVLIGGGENGRPGYPYETYEIDKAICELSKKKQNVLFVGLSQVTSGEDHIIKYYNSIKNIYGNIFGYDVINFDCYNFMNDLQRTINQINNADIIYFGGGDTEYLVHTLKKYNLDKTIIQACKNGTVLAGLSAGANLMGNKGLTLVKYKNFQTKEPVSIEGLNLVPFVVVPHYNKDKIRQEQLKVYLSQNKNLIGLGIDDGCAFLCKGDLCKTVQSLPNACVHICKYSNNEYTTKSLNINEFIKIKSLLK